MFFKQFNKRVCRAFSNSAIQYEVLASMQYEIGRDLIKSLAWTEHCQNILDIGMGTGKLTNRLSHLCPGARIVGLDFADGMVQEAKRKYETFTIVQADALALPFADQSFEAVLSNLAYQWVGDMPKAFGEARRVLKKDGSFCATLFGRGTLPELFESLENVASQQERKCELQKLNDQETIRCALEKAGFKDIQVRAEIIKTHFDDMHSLLKWLKLIGANMMNRNFFIGPRYINQSAEYYEKNFKGRWGIVASFEVIWVKGIK